MAVPIETEPSFAAGNPALVLEGNYLSNTLARPYDIAPDGERFLMIKPVGADDGSTTELILVQNWFES
jgi:hypothetical protein